MFKRERSPSHALFFVFDSVSLRPNYLNFFLSRQIFMNNVDLFIIFKPTCSSKLDKKIGEIALKGPVHEKSSRIT